MDSTLLRLPHVKKYRTFNKSIVNVQTYYVNLCAKVWDVALPIFILLLTKSYDSRNKTKFIYHNLENANVSTTKATEDFIELEKLLRWHHQLTKSYEYYVICLTFYLLL